jgi:3-carboxy-cis,cis-muconate cycloisomerase
MSSSERGRLFGALFDRGPADTGDEAWLQAMLDTEAGLARALERAGLAAAGAGAAVSAAARAGGFDAGELGRLAAAAGNPVPALVRALTAKLPPEAAAAVHKGATSQDIIDTAVMLLGLARPAVPWHTDRLRILELAAALAGTCGVLSKVARDVTLLAQSEVAEVRETDPGPGQARGGGRRGGSSAMPHKRNPVAAIVILGCARRAPGLLATLAACAEQEHQRAAGAWHAEWEPVADLLRLTGSAASWAAELLAGLEVDARRMRANLDAAGGFPLAESVAAALAPSLGPPAAHDLVAEASAKAAAAGQGFRDALLSPPLAARLAEAGITADRIDAALDPAAYLGSAVAFTDAALAAHRSLPS